MYTALTATHRSTTIDQSDETNLVAPSTENYQQRCLFVHNLGFARPQRLALTKALGWANVPCTVIGLIMRSPVMHHTGCGRSASLVDPGVAFFVCFQYERVQMFTHAPPGKKTDASSRDSS